jgi:acetyl-CoA synthetase
MLTDRVTLANPLDIHTYLWFDPPALQRVFRTILHAGYDAVGFMLDSPPEDAADTAAFDVVIDAFIAASRGAQARAALIASLPETLSRRVRERCLHGGVVPLQGLREALEALSLAGAVTAAWRSHAPVGLSLPSARGSFAEHVRSLSEHDSKRQLAPFGLKVPRGLAVAAEGAAAAAAELGFPVAMKAVGAHLEHKTEVGALVLNVRNPTEAVAAAARLGTLSQTLLVEEMCTDGVAEILIGVIVDAQFGQVLVLGAGGVYTELMADSVSLLPPWTKDTVAAGLERLAITRLFAGYRGKPAADVPALIEAVLSVARYAAANQARLVELDVNPVIVRPIGCGAMAVDAMIRLKTPNSLQGT